MVICKWPLPPVSSTHKNVAAPPAILKVLAAVVVTVMFCEVPLTETGKVLVVPAVKLTLRPIMVFVTVAGVIPKRVAASVFPETVVGTENCAPVRTPSGAATFRE